MAEKKTRLNASDIGSIRPDSSNVGGEIHKALEHLRENLLLYVAAVVFVILCIVAGILFRLSSMAAEREIMTQYASAMTIEDPALRAAELESVARLGGRWGHEALYALGEAAIQAGEYDRARNAFQQLISEAGNSEFAPQAAEGMAWLAENRGDLEEALLGYQAVEKEYPESFLARIQPLNKARVLEKKEDLPGAIAAYEEQMGVFPDSNAAREAEAALERLRGSHPELFPEPVVEALPELESLEADEAEAVDGGDEALDSASESAGEAGEALEDAAEAVAETVEEGLEVAEELVEELMDGAEDAAESAGASVDSVEETVEETADSVEEVVETEAVEEQGATTE